MDVKTEKDNSRPSGGSAKKGKKKDRKSTSKPGCNLPRTPRKKPNKSDDQEMLIIRDHFQKAREAKNKVKHETGVVYDERMAEHKCLWDSTYPECPERFTVTIERCRDLGLLDRCLQICPRKAMEEEILMLHSDKHLSTLKNTSGNQNSDELESLSGKFHCIYIHPSTYEIAMLAAGSTIELVDNILKGRVQNGMAIVRPPGHHAMNSEYCGYCFFNNIALGAQHALDVHGIKKVLIVDWDVHHGQATQQMFYKDDRVLYFSIHRYEHGMFWPSEKESDFHYIGTGIGKGYNFNVPLNKTGMNNADYMAIFHQVLLPVAYEFQPELVMVSAGFDAAIGCPEGEMEVTPACFAHFTSSLMGLADGKVAVVYEGGYCLKSLAEGAALTLRCLLGDPCPVIDCHEEPCDSVTESILNVIYSHKLYWNCFQFQGTYSENSTETEGHKIYHCPEVKYFGTVERDEAYYNTRNCYPVQSPELIKNINERLSTLNIRTKLSVPPHCVCLTYDAEMMSHKNLFEPGHPEKPERISEIFSCHQEYNLLERCLQLKSRCVTDEELLLIHDAKYIEETKATSEMKPKELAWIQGNYRSVYLHPNTHKAALLAAGCVLQTVDSVLNGESQSGVAIVRPPGHHAEDDEACGFCIFNNVALAAKYAIEMHSLKRILLVDWDVHHGNGTQHIFYDDPKVLYISLHRYDNGFFFPCLPDANYGVVGSGKGEGYTVNIPWNKGGMGDAEYLSAFHNLILPVAYQYNPELVLISAGFDAARGDPLGGCKISPEGYGHMTHLLKSLAGGRVIIALEGGYNLAAISYSMTMCTKALLGDPVPSLDDSNGPNFSAVASISNTIGVHKKFWSCLRYQVDLPEEDVIGMNSITETNASVTPEESSWVTVSSMSGEDLEGIDLNDSGSDVKSPDIEAAGNAEEKSPDIGAAGDAEEKSPDVGAAGNAREKSPDVRADGNTEEKSPDIEVAGNAEEVALADKVTAVLTVSDTHDQGQASDKYDELMEKNTLPEREKQESKEDIGETKEGNLMPVQELSACSDHTEETEPVNVGASSGTQSGESESIGESEKFDNNHSFTVADSPLHDVPRIGYSTFDGENKGEENFPTTEASSCSSANVLPTISNSEASVGISEHLNIDCVGNEDIAEADSSAAAETGSCATDFIEEGCRGAEALAPQYTTLQAYFELPENSMLPEGGMYAVMPLSWCPHLETVRPVPNRGLDTSAICEECGEVNENWVCLVCYSVHCGRYINEHMLLHGLETEHLVTLSYADISVWCYGCESYVDHMILYEAKNAAHRDKFGEEMTWSFGPR